MRLLTYLIILTFLSSCTTIEVTKEVVKVGNVVKEKVAERFEEQENEIVEDKTIVEEQQIIIEEKKEEKTIVQTQQKLDETRNKIHESLAQLKKDNNGLENGNFEISSTFNPNLEELRLDTGLRATSNFTRYLISYSNNLFINF